MSSTPNDQDDGKAKRSAQSPFTPYEITRRGINDQGNRYDIREQLSGRGRHYSNLDGSYDYENGDNSKYHNDGHGRATYTTPNGLKYDVSRPNDSSAASTSNDGAERGYVNHEGEGEDEDEEAALAGHRDTLSCMESDRDYPRSSDRDHHLPDYSRSGVEGREGPASMGYSASSEEPYDRGGGVEHEAEETEEFVECRENYDEDYDEDDDDIGDYGDDFGDDEDGSYGDDNDDRGCDGDNTFYDDEDNDDY